MPSGDTVDLTVVWADSASVSVQGIDPSITSTEVVTYPDTGPVSGISAITAGYDVTTGYTTWTFTWKTTNPSLDDAVYIKSQKNGVCEVVPSGQSELELKASTHPAVFRTCRALGNGQYLHTLSWGGPLCMAPCTYQYRVRSWGTGPSAVTSSYQQFSVPICAGIQQ